VRSNRRPDDGRARPWGFPRRDYAGHEEFRSNLNTMSKRGFPLKMAPFVAGSISGYINPHACRTNVYWIGDSRRDRPFAQRFETAGVARPLRFDVANQR
jgi:hypothetical protein